MTDIKGIKQQIEFSSPLILNLTNLVTMDFMANTLLALGASPIMSNDKDDALELYNISSAININIGTLNKDFMKMAMEVAEKNDKQKPLVLDPVGTGASKPRSEASAELLPYCTILRGNASEITALQLSSFKTKGVDATTSSNTAVEHAIALSKQYHIPVAISGEIDYTIFNNIQHQCPFGSALMPKITGMGCVLTSVIAAFSAVLDDPVKATHSALMFYSLCGELAYRKDPTLAFFKNYFIEMIHSPDYDYIQNKLKDLGA